MLRILLFFCFMSVSFAQSPSSFTQSKKIAAQLFQQHSQTIYCHCQYENKEVNLASCGMQAAGSIKRAHRIEWEHIMAAEHFGQQFECWRTPICEDSHGKAYKGRRCCEKIDEQYRHVEAELYNLWPEVGVVNQARSNYRFGVLPELSDYLGCTMKIDKKTRRAEPPDVAKGVVARAYLFMADHYGLSLSASQKQLFTAWNKTFAPTVWEKQWALQVAVIEGYDNPYITHWQANSQKIATR
ncbi:TPA: endonuclease [Legionella pneumophila]|nr:deoxyribonuclease [Legionella pneumophila]HBD9260124.1 endonuclease [Legionella pneumophila]HCE5644427.1 endonuclease [Legionella pneumophila]HCE5647400.1 endonuclease [Legionella pneumophila]HCX3264726.1 endonuclease [Legionella pneumophila]